MNVIDPHYLILATLPIPTEWIAPLIAIAATAYVLYRSRMRLKKDPLFRLPAANSLSQQRSVERQMQNLLVELSEMARQVTAGLDTRAAKLDALIREADEKIARLTALLRAASPEQSNGATSAPAAPVPPPPCAYEPDPRHVEVYTLADQGQTPSQIAGQLNRPNGEIELILALRPRDGV
jgi:DNA-binding NarL/FixJ family response regulator